MARASTVLTRALALALGPWAMALTSASQKTYTPCKQSACDEGSDTLSLLEQEDPRRSRYQRQPPPPPAPAPAAAAPGSSAAAASEDPLGGAYAPLPCPCNRRELGWHTWHTVSVFSLVDYLSLDTKHWGHFCMM